MANLGVTFRDVICSKRHDLFKKIEPTKTKNIKGVPRKASSTLVAGCCNCRSGMRYCLQVGNFSISLHKSSRLLQTAADLQPRLNEP